MLSLVYTNYTNSAVLSPIVHRYLSDFIPNSKTIIAISLPVYAGFDRKIVTIWDCKRLWVCYYVLELSSQVRDVSEDDVIL